MKCRKCGAEIPKGELFCPNCGAEVQLVPDYNSVEYLLNQKREKEQLQREEEIKSGSGKKKKHSSAKAVLITLLIITICALLGITAKYIIDNRNLNDYDYQMNQANTAYNSSNYSDAFTFVTQALHLKPDSDEAKFLLANVLIGQKKYDEAEKTLKDLIAKNPGDTDSYGALIQIYETEQKPDAIKALLEGSTSTDVREKFAAYIASVPTFDPKEGDYDKLLDVAITCDAGKIYYTTDGSDPTKDSTEYSEKIPAKEGRNEIRAISVNDKGISSDVAIAVYNITLPVPDPAKILPASGNYVTGTKITVTYPAGCTAYFAFDAIPDTNGTVYTEPVSMLSGTHVFSVVVKDKNGKVSAPASETYVAK